ncbi:MAG: hypothetical protein V4667_08010 [Bacteroidota bacterium]
MNKFCFLISFIFYFFVAQFANAQNDTLISKELKFVDYLINNKEFDDANLILEKNKKLVEENGSKSQIDSFYYFKGWSFYNNKNIDSSIVYLSRVSGESNLFLKSKFYQTFEYIYLKKYSFAEKELAVFNPPDSLLIELKNFQLAASALLKKEYSRFDSVANKFTYTNFSCSIEQKNLFKYKDDFLKNKKKSPFVAGLFSAIIPGTGKFYAGYRGQAIAAMIPSFIFGAVATENYIKAGPKSAQFIVAASIFSIFYVGNIWGSVLSVKTLYEQRNNETINNIMLDLHIPLRRLFE